MTIVTPCHGMYIPNIFEIFPKFFLLVTHYLLSKSPYVCFLWCGLSMSLLVLMLKVSGSLALWTCLSVLALYLLLSVCLQVPVLLSGSTLVLDPWLPWLVRVVEQCVVGDNLGLLLGWQGGGGITVLVYCSICSCPKI
jgi:hypothetical protein